MSQEQRLEVIKNRMGNEWFNQAFQYKNSVEGFIKQWEDYYSRLDHEKNLESKYRNEYEWKPYEKFDMFYTEFKNVKYLVCYCGTKNKKKYGSINGFVFELNSNFRKNIEEFFQIPGIGLYMAANFKFCLKMSKVRGVDTIFKTIMTE